MVFVHSVRFLIVIPAKPMIPTFVLNATLDSYSQVDNVYVRMEFWLSMNSVFAHLVTFMDAYLVFRNFLMNVRNAYHIYILKIQYVNAMVRMKNSMKKNNAANAWLSIVSLVKVMIAIIALSVKMMKVRLLMVSAL